VNLSYLDWLIILVYITLIIYTGYLAKKYIAKISDFLVADRSMGFHLGLVSLMSSEIGIITYMYLAEAGYTNGFVALIIGIPFFIVFLFLGKTGFIIKPLLEMKIMTIPELFQKKFGKGVRFYAAFLMAIGGIINFGVFPGVEAKFINTITGIPQEYLLFTMVVLLTIVLIYTAVGGMVSVIITNYVQFILLSLGMVFITVFGVIKIGWHNIVNAVQVNFNLQGFNPFVEGGNFGWSFLLWQLLFQLAVLTIAPYITMRLFSSKDSKTGKKIFTWSSIMFLARAVIPIFWGILALAYLVQKPDDPLQALPLMILGLTPKGILGLIFAALLAASMSTYASYLLSWSSVISQDLLDVAIKRFTKKEISNKTQLIISRCTMAGVILFIIWWSFIYQAEGLLFFYLMLAVNLFLAGTLVSAVFGIYFMKDKFGLLKARPLGSYLAFTLGALPTIWYFLPDHPSASQLGVWGFILAFIGMIIGSLIQNILRPKSIEEMGN
jgi:SSS family solute:Na+ symporter